MADRSISVKLRAEVDQYRRAMDDAAKSTEKVGTSAESTSKKADGALSKMMRSAQENREAWSTVGTTLVAAGGAVAAFGVAALKTGIEYNTLQQTSRAALTSLLGSARAANDQMDKLDAFAKKSPFSKSTFIQAQQQMLAFGIETRKVIPYLDAVQNAVAAAGGSNADIEGIVATMSKVQSSAKITAEDLNELGNRGVNAAELIGSQMGMTGAQIRDAISNGSLDATQALDALAAGMSERFAGAADNVKNTFAGATDRVKAAWRDFASELATPLVNPEGGGALVDFLNGVADAMRNFSKLPEPVKNAVTALAGVGGVAALAAGGLLLLVPRVADTVEGFQKFAPAGGRVRGALVGIGKAAGAALAVQALVPILDDLTNTGDKTAAGLNVTKNALLGIRNANVDTLFEDLGASFDDFGGALDIAIGDGAKAKVERFGSSLNTIFFGGRLSDQVRDAKEQFATIGEALASMVEGGNGDRAAEISAEISAQAQAQGYSIEELNALMPAYRESLAGVAAEQHVAVESTSTLAGWQQRLAEQMASMDPAAKANAEAFAALVESTDNAGGAFLDFSDDLGDAEFSLDGWLTKLDENAAAVSAWSDNIAAIAARGASRQLLQALIEEGPAAAQAVSALASGTEADMARAEAAFAGPAQSLEDLQAQLAEKYLLEVDTAAATASVFDFAAFYTQTGADLSPWAAHINKAPAEGQTSALQSWIERQQPDPFNLRADDSSARGTANAFVNTKRSTSVNVFANTNPAQAAIASLSYQRITVGVDAAVGSAQRVIAGLGGGYTGGKVGSIVGYADGGRLPGVPPSNPSSDNLLAVTERGRPIAVRSREWIVSQPASDHYGDRIMSAINSRRVPREVLSGYAAGGVPMPVTSGVASVALPGISSAELAAALTGMAFTLMIDGNPVRAIARAEATSAIRTSQARRVAR